MFDQISIVEFRARNFENRRVRLTYPRRCSESLSRKRQTDHPLMRVSFRVQSGEFLIWRVKLAMTIVCTFAGRGDSAGIDILDVDPQSGTTLILNV